MTETRHRMSNPTLWNTWQRTAAAKPHAVAVIDARDGRVHTYADVTAAASAVAADAPGALARGHAVAFAEPNGARWLAWFLGLQKLGAVVLPLDSALPAAQRAETAAALGARWLLDADGRWENVAPDAPAFAEDICLLKTTSGSTGLPRALAFTAENMLADGRHIAATMEIGPDDINLGAIPFGHSYGLGNLILPLLVQGTVVVASREILPDALAAQVEQFRVTVLPSVPAVLRGLAGSSVDPRRVGSLRRVISAGGPLHAGVPAMFNEKFRCPIRNFYGSSETGGICFDRTGEATLSGRSVGLPLEGVKVQLDEEGRVMVRSAAVMSPGEHTLADLGVWSERGELVLTGRATPLANIGGKKVSPLEIERALRALAGVADAWVGVQARRFGGGDFLLAAVETERSGEDIRADLAARLPTWQVPRRLWITARLPRTERGKLDRRELETRCLGEPPPAGED